MYEYSWYEVPYWYEYLLPACVHAGTRQAGSTNVHVREQYKHISNIIDDLGYIVRDRQYGIVSERTDARHINPLGSVRSPEILHNRRTLYPPICQPVPLLGLGLRQRLGPCHASPARGAGHLQPSMLSSPAPPSWLFIPYIGAARTAHPPYIGGPVWTTPPELPIHTCNKSPGRVHLLPPPPHGSMRAP